MKDFFKIIYLSAFVALMFIKVSGFHVYSHLDDDHSSIEKCASCELAIEQQQSVFTAPVLIHFQEVIILEDATSAVFEEQSLVLQATLSDFFSRPPPITV